MEIKKVLVVRNDDAFQAGTIFVQDAKSNKQFKVKYTSPYITRYAGFVAIPEINTPILIVKPDNDNSWYYMSSIIFPDAHMRDETKSIDPEPLLPDPKVYNARGVPQRISLKDMRGNKIELTSEYNEKYFNSGVRVAAGSGKKLLLSDSPEQDCIIISNEHGDKIKISSSPNSSTGERGIDIDCAGTINISSRGGAMNLLVVDGRELNITNKSTGSKRTGPNDPTPGQVNITSLHADVNITTKGEASDVHITTEGENGNIVLQSEKGVVQILGAGGVQIAGADKDGNIVSDVVVKGTKIHLN